MASHPKPNIPMQKIQTKPRYRVDKTRKEKVNANHNTALVL